MDTSDTRVLSGQGACAGVFPFRKCPGQGIMVALIFITVQAASLYCDVLEPLIHSGVICLTEEPLASQFAQRLVAEGKPVFYISDVVKGVSQGDLIRFKNKAVLIDGDVWQTLMSMGILSRLKDIPVMTLTARANSEVWDSRSDMVSNSKENKGYTLGRELLKIFEDYFGNTPSSMEMVVKFHGSNLTIVAPVQLLNELNFTNVTRVQKQAPEKPFFITLRPPEKIFASQQFSWTIWAIDPGEYAAQLQYSCAADLPPGLSWDAQRHTIRGVPSAAGQWRLSLSVRNSKNGAASMVCTLAVLDNTAPRLFARYSEPLFAGSHLEYAPIVADAEHTLDELEIRLFNQPENMRFDTPRGVIVWDPPAIAHDTLVQFAVAAKDPLDAVTREKMALRIISPVAADRTITIDFRLPLDTMIQGHTYSWPDDAWMKAEWHERSLTLASISGDDSTRYRAARDSLEGELAITPMRPGTHTLLFTFLSDTVKIEVRKSCVVIPNRAPVFNGSLTTHEYMRGQFAEYIPAVTDEDGDSLRLTIVAQNGTETEVKAGRIRLATKEAGLHTLTVVARDPFGNRAQRQIYYSVNNADAAESRMAWYLQKTNRNSTDLGFCSGALRVGFFSADVVKTVTTGFLGINTIETPFLFFGANPLGNRQAAIGNYLYLDGGISFRVYNERIYGGGVLGRIQANYRHKGTSPWRFTALFTARLKQAIFIADTTGLVKELREYAETYETQSVIDSSIMRYMDGLREVLKAYGQADNFGFYLCFQTLYRLPVGLWLGPAAWVEDDIVQTHFADTSGVSPPDDAGEPIDQANIFAQFTGVCLLHEWRFRFFHYWQQFYIGWGKASPVPKLQWQFMVEAVRVRKH